MNINPLDACSNLLVEHIARSEMALEKRVAISISLNLNFQRRTRLGWSRQTCFAGSVCLEMVLVTLEVDFRIILLAETSNFVKQLSFYHLLKDLKAQAFLLAWDPVNLIYGAQIQKKSKNEKHLSHLSLSQLLLTCHFSIHPFVLQRALNIFYHLGVQFSRF